MPRSLHITVAAASITLRTAFALLSVPSMRNVRWMRAPMRGREGNVHRGRPHQGQYAMISHLGAMLPVADGLALAAKLLGIPALIVMPAGIHS